MKLLEAAHFPSFDRPHVECSICHRYYAVTVTNATLDLFTLLGPVVAQEFWVKNLPVTACTGQQVCEGSTVYMSSC